VGTLFGFLVGYIVGARAGSEGFDGVVQALRRIRESDEFRGFVQVVRSHARDTASTLAARLAEEGGARRTAEELVARARSRAGGS